MDEYTKKFHDLNGSTISEYQKNFNIYLQELKSSNFDKNVFLESLQPQNQQQELFYARLLIEFAPRNKLLEALTRGNKSTVKTLLRKADLRALFHGVTGKQFVEEICVKLSSSSRMKLMNKLGKCRGVDCDDYFQNAAGAYGFENCKALLVNCKEGVLRSYVVNTNVRFTDSELITIYCNHGVEVLSLYFLNRKRNVSFTYCKKLVNYLVSHDVAAFFELLKFGHPKLGRRGLKILLSSNASVDLNNFNLNFKLFYHLFPVEEYVNVFKKSMPSDVSKFLGTFSRATSDFLTKIHKPLRGKILFEAFEEKYGFEINSSLSYVNKQILSLLALEDRLKFKLESDYVQMLNVEESIPLLKKQIDATTSPCVRIPLMRKLVETCKINNDLVALKELIKYFNKRHKNDDRYVRDAFFYEILFSFKHDSLDDETWKLISEAIEVFTVNKEFFDGIFLFLETDIYNKFMKGEDFSKELRRYLKDTGVYMNWNLLQKHPEVEKACILKSHEFIAEIFNKEDQFYAHVEFLNSIDDWNKRHSSQKISYLQFPRSIQTVLSDTQALLYYQSKVLLKSLEVAPKNDVERELYGEMLTRIFKVDQQCLTEQLSMWLLKTHPDVLLGKAKIFLSKSVCNFKFLRKLARSHFLKAHGEFVKVALDILSNSGGHENELNGAFMFLTFIPKYFQILETCLIGNENPVLAKNLLKNLKYNEIPVMNLNLITRFIKLKYPNMITATLYSTLNHTSEEILIGFIKTCEDNQVFGLITVLVNAEVSLGIIERAWNGGNQKRKFIFKCLLRLSFRNQRAWELVLSQLQTLKHPFVPKLAEIPKNRINLFLNAIFKCDLSDESKYVLLMQLDPAIVDSGLLGTILTVCGKSLKVDDEKFKGFLYQVFLHNSQLIERADNELIADVARVLCIKALEETEEVNLAKNMVTSLAGINHSNYATSVFLKLTLHYLQSGFENFPQLLLAQLQNSLELHGSDVKFIYMSTVKSFLESLPENADSERLDVADKLVQSGNVDASVLCLAIEILPIALPKNEILLRKCCSVVERVESYNIPIVDVYLCKYLKCLD